DGTTNATVLTTSLGAVLGGDDVTLTAGPASFSDKNAGTGKTVTLAGAVLSGADVGNYVLDAVTTTTADITKAALTVTANSYSKPYDGLAYSGGDGVSYAGFVNGETAAVLGGTLTYGGNAQGAINAGNYTITAKGLTSDNYDITYAPGTLTI